MADLEVILLLAILQGLTEFLPVSSSGHLVLMMAVLERFGRSVTTPITVNVALHMGTLAATVGYFWERLRTIVQREWRTAALVLLASLPAVVVGFPLRKFLGETLEDPWVAAGGLIGTGFLLLIGSFLGRGNRRISDLRWWEAVVIGCFQAVALLPGVSRSGSTIVGGLLYQLAPGEAAVFAFLMAVPAMMGAGVLEAWEIVGSPQPIPPWWNLGLGMVLAGVVGWLAIAWLLVWVRSGRLQLFAWWVFAVGGAGLLWLILDR